MKKTTLLTALLLLIFASLISGVFAVCYTASGLIKNPPKPGVTSADNRRFTADIFTLPSGIFNR